MPMMPSRLPQMRWPSIQVGVQPLQSLSDVSTLEPSASRRGTARISAMVMSAVSSVRTPGVLVTVMPRCTAVTTSILSTPLPKLAISLSCSPDLESTAVSIRSVTVGTSTSAVFTASANSACVMGLSSALKRTSKSSLMRSSTLSGSLRVTTTSGFLVFGMSCTAVSGGPYGQSGACSALFNRRRPHCASRVGSIIRTFSYQMAMTTQSAAAAIRLLGGLVGSLALVALFMAAPAAAGPSAGDMTTGSVSGLPVPRFVSLKSDRVNVRSGPNKDQEVRWVYTRAGMPVEITAEFENWRRIRDWEGAEGWVYHSLLSGKRSAVVVPDLKNDLVPLFESADPKSAETARLQSGVLGMLKSCTGSWCEFVGKNFDGWIRQERLWGAYPNEKVE